MNGIVKNQHVFPSMSIKRFYDEKGFVTAHIVSANKTVQLTSTNKLFTVRKVWDQRAEKGYGKSIEDSFQMLMEEILTDNRRIFSDDENEIITQFYLLWSIRSSINSYEIPAEGKLVGVSGQYLTEEQKVNIEMRHGAYVDESGRVPKHILRGRAMQLGISGFVKRNRGIYWYLAKSKHLEFVVSDNPSTNFLIPVTPKSVLMAQFDIRELDIETVRRFNFEAIFGSKNYYFTRNLSKVFYA